ncbi:MAG: molybdenum cofactor guanylyltransferase [Deltaproteobacteria bacterium]|nr:molybdenum cofactor guanylyltransferase [Deltaproteobacteria bacterium]
MMRHDLTGVVLAGGRSERFGSDKRIALLDGASLLDRAVAILREVAPRVLVSLARGEPAVAGLEAARDDRPDAGPLAGIAAGLRAASTPLCAFLPVDMPLVPPALLLALADAAGDRGAVVDDGRGIQPLVAVYPRSLLPLAEEALARGERAVHRLALRANAAALGPDALRAFGDPDRFLLNVNTPDDLRETASRPRAGQGRAPRAPRLPPR